MLPRRIFFDDMLDDFKKQEQMRTDIYEKDDVYHVEVDITGFKKEDLKIELNQGNLIIKAEHKSEEVDDNRKYLHRERKFYGKVERSYYLGDVDEDNVKASFLNGVLEVTVPKKKEINTSKVIEID